MRARCIALLALVALAGGCLDDALGIPIDGGVFDFSHRVDLARLDLVGADLAGVEVSTPDLASGCTHLSSLSDLNAETRGSPTETPFDYVTWARSFAAGPAVSIEIWHDGTPPGAPYGLFLPSDTNYLLCEVCVLVDLSFDPGLGYGSPAYLALGGEFSVQVADTNPTKGGLHVGGTNLHLVEWDFAGDRPRPGGGCYDIDVLELAGNYSGDGGDPPRWK